jgi:hypothetical protein
MKTIGISPKVWIPTLALFTAGIVLVVLGAILDDHDVRTMGLTALGAAVAAAGAGYSAAPGNVVRK